MKADCALLQGIVHTVEVVTPSGIQTWWGFFGSERRYAAPSLHQLMFMARHDASFEALAQWCSFLDHSDLEMIAAEDELELEEQWN